jgi:hypothetical protein
LLIHYLLASGFSSQLVCLRVKCQILTNFFELPFPMAYCKINHQLVNHCVRFCFLLFICYVYFVCFWQMSKRLLSATTAQFDPSELSPSSLVPTGLWSWYASAVICCDKYTNLQKHLIAVIWNGVYKKCTLTS